MVNEKHSTGLNALRHSLTGQVVVMPPDDLAAYQAHLKSFTAEYSPKGATEANLVQSLADTAWRMNRAAVLESNVLSLAATGNPLTDAQGIAAALESQCKSLGILSMHSQRLSRQFERTVTQLRALQKERRAQEEHDLDGLLNILEMYKGKEDTYDPAADGFVFSKEQIAQATTARNRQNRIDKAFHVAHPW